MVGSLTPEQQERYAEFLGRMGWAFQSVLELNQQRQLREKMRFIQRVTGL